MIPVQSLRSHWIRGLICAGVVRSSVYFALLFLLGFSAQNLQGATNDWKDEWDAPDGFSLAIDTEGFDYPTAIAFVPNPGPDPKSPLYFVTEIRGKLKVVTRDRSVFVFAVAPFDLTPAQELPSVDGEHGLASIALDPVHGYIFAGLAYYDDDQVLRNVIVRFDSEPKTFGLKALRTTSFNEFLKNDSSTPTHQTGGIIVDGDSLLVSIGDGGQFHRSQNIDSSLGKILRMSLDGKPLADNPFYQDDDITKPRNYVWALGFRNPFGLARVNGKTFVSENGFHMDRFLEVRRGENRGWNGTDWSIGMNAALAVGPTISPVQIGWIPRDTTLFPEEYRSKFIVAMAGGVTHSAGLLLLDYDFVNSKLAQPPKPFLLHAKREKTGVYPVGAAMGPDGFYMVSLFSVREKGYGKGEVIRISYDPATRHTITGVSESRTEILMMEKGCYSCHGRTLSDLNVGPPLDRETLVPRILRRLRTASYKRASLRLDASPEQPYVAYRQARKEVLAKAGADQARTWLTYHLLEPKFDRSSASMPNMGLNEKEAAQIADYLMERNIGSTGITGFFKKFINPYIYGPVGRRHLPGAFAMGFLCAVGFFTLRKAFRRISARRQVTDRHLTDGN